MGLLVQNPQDSQLILSAHDLTEADGRTQTQFRWGFQACHRSNSFSGPILAMCRSVYSIVFVYTCNNVSAEQSLPIPMEAAREHTSKSPLRSHACRWGRAH